MAVIGLNNHTFTILLNYAINEEYESTQPASHLQHYPMKRPSRNQYVLVLDKASLIPCTIETPMGGSSPSGGQYISISQAKMTLYYKKAFVSCEIKTFDIMNEGDGRTVAP